MKLAILLLSLTSFSVLSADIKLKDYNWTLTDIASTGFTKDVLFSRMDRKYIKLGSSICSNRALMWANNFKRDYNLDTAKIFLFYTERPEEERSLKTWWYHVAPVVNENGKTWVIDGGFPGFVNGPMSTEEWLLKFAKSKNCKEINANDTELVELIFTQYSFPHRTSHGYYDCYFKIVPHTFWTPEIVAQNLLGRDKSGRPVRVERDEINRDELYQSCLEATTNKIEFALGAGKEKCKEYVRGF